MRGMGRDNGGLKKGRSDTDPKKARVRVETLEMSLGKEQGLAGGPTIGACLRKQ